VNQQGPGSLELVMAASSAAKIGVALQGSPLCCSCSSGLRELGCDSGCALLHGNAWSDWFDACLERESWSLYTLRNAFAASWSGWRCILMCARHFSYILPQPCHSEAFCNRTRTTCTLARVMQVMHAHTSAVVFSGFDWPRCHLKT